MPDTCSKTDALAAAAADMLAALKEIETICTEDRAACRRRMGTRVGNVLVTATAAIAAAAKVEVP